MVESAFCLLSWNSTGLQTVGLSLFCAYGSLWNISYYISAISNVWERWQKAWCYIKSSFNLLINLSLFVAVSVLQFSILRWIRGTLVGCIILKFIVSHLGSAIIFVIITPECIIESTTVSWVVPFSLFIKFCCCCCGWYLKRPAWKGRALIYGLKVELRGVSRYDLI